MPSHSTPDIHAPRSGRSSMTAVDTLSPRLDAEKKLRVPPSSGISYPGSGTADDPFLVSWTDDLGQGRDPENPQNLTAGRKWTITVINAIVTLCIAFASSAYSGGIRELLIKFRVATEVITLGISLFVVGFGVGPLLWAPLAEMYGRRLIFIVTFTPFVFFNLGGALGNNIETILITRFLGGLFGASPLVNAGGALADVFNARERGPASALFALAPFLGPVLGPIVGGYSAQGSGWHAPFWVMFGFGLVLLLAGTLFVPETYSPYLLRKKAAKLSKETDLVYISKLDVGRPTKLTEILAISLKRPFVLLFKEPIVFALSAYAAVIYGILYLLFAAFPIVFQTYRGWSSGKGGLAFIGVGIGMIMGVMGAGYFDKLYIRASDKSADGVAPPEARLVQACVGGILLPVGLGIFAATCTPDIHWIAPIIAGVPFGCGMLFVFLSIIMYLVDSYTIYSASALAANAVFRSVLGAAFPLFTARMYDACGLQWGSAIPCFLALICAPMPFLFYRYGARIRARSKFAASATSSLPEPVTTKSSSEA